MIGLENQVFCPLCNKQYKENNLPRILTMCGHTYCELCISNMITSFISESQADQGHPFIIQCPDDGATLKLTVNELKIFPKNIALIKVIDNKKNNSSFKDESLNLSKIVKKQQLPEDDEANDIISAINECKQTKEIQNCSRQSQQIDSDKKVQNEVIQTCKKTEQKISAYTMQQKQDEQLCLLHQKPLQIVCIIDHKKICSKCAIFGQHKGHEFKTIEEVQAQKNQCYMAILQIFKQKQQAQKRISNQETESGLIEILDKKRDILEKQVREQFRKLRQQITKQEKIVLKKLQETYKKTESNIKSMLKIDDIIMKDFSCWEQSSYKVLKILQDLQIETKVKALYSKDKNISKVINQGKQILGKIKDQQKSLVAKVEAILVDLECKKNKKVYEFIPSMVEISDKPIQIIEPMVTCKNEKLVNMTVSTLVVQTHDKQKISKSNCTIIDTFDHKSNIMDGSPLLEESLLEGEQMPANIADISQVQVKKFSHQSEARIPLKSNEDIINRNIQDDPISCSFIQLELQSAKKVPFKTATKKNFDLETSFMENSRVSSILTSRPSLMMKNQHGQRPNKKKLKSIKISQKYQKMLEGIYNNTVDTIDLTNAEVGDQTMAQICEFVKYSKARTIKFIRNKLTDSGIEKLLPSLSNAQILNLSQNNLTQAVIDIFIKHRFGYLSGIKNIILSQNKIIERKHKAKIDQLRAMNVVVSV